MSTKSTRGKMASMLAVGTAYLAYAVSMSAQVQTQTTTAHTPTVQTTVERADVITVSGNDLLVKMEDGTIRHIANVPESARVTVNGQQLGIHDLKPGMKLQRTITTTTAPKTITNVQNVKGKIWYVNPPVSVILTLEDGTNQQFKIPKGQKFNVDGQMLDAWGLKKGMNVTATKVVEQSTVEVEKQRQLTGTMAPPPPAPPTDVPILVAEATPPAPSTASREAAFEKLPRTGSDLPLIALLGFLLLAVGLGVRAFRKSRGNKPMGDRTVL